MGRVGFSCRMVLLTIVHVTTGFVLFPWLLSRHHHNGVTAAHLPNLQEWVPGGELFYHLDREGAFDDSTAMFYAANVLLALEFLHTQGIVYRDLKPENILLD